MSTNPVSPEEIRHALRSLRPSIYRLDSTAAQTTLALVMNASPSGRHNAATKIVALLAGHGLCLDAADPVDTLTQRRDGLIVTRRAPDEPAN